MSDIVVTLQLPVVSDDCSPAWILLSSKQCWEPVIFINHTLGQQHSLGQVRPHQTQQTQQVADCGDCQSPPRLSFLSASPKSEVLVGWWYYNLLKRIVIFWPLLLAHYTILSITTISILNLNCLELNFLWCYFILVSISDPLFYVNISVSSVTVTGISKSPKFTTKEFFTVTWIAAPFYK